MSFAHHLATMITAIASVLLALRALGLRRSPQSVLAWLLGIVFLPYIAAPLYLVFGLRKLPKRVREKARPFAPDVAAQAPEPPRGTVQRVLFTMGLPPAREGNRFELLPDGVRAYAALLAQIRGARRSIHLTMFLLGDDAVARSLVEALAERARAGVEVRVILDAVGSMHTARAAGCVLREAGGELRIFMPLCRAPLRGRANLRSHRKLVIFDGAALFTGGINLAEEYLGPAPLPGRWRDFAAIVAGPVAFDAEELFAADWEFCGGARGELAAVDPPAPIVGGAVLQLVPSGPDVRSDAFHDALVTAISSAKERVAIVSPYFIPDAPSLLALALAARRGVKTQIVLPAKSNHRIADFARRAPLRELARAGVEIALYRPGMVHAKAMIADDDFAYLGSPNFDVRSFYLDYENALILHDVAHVGVIRAWIDALYAECDHGPAPVHPEQPLLEELAHLLAPEL